MDNNNNQLAEFLARFERMFNAQTERLNNALEATVLRQNQQQQVLQQLLAHQMQQQFEYQRLGQHLNNLISYPNPPVYDAYVYGEPANYIYQHPAPGLLAADQPPSYNDVVYAQQQQQGGEQPPPYEDVGYEQQQNADHVPFEVDAGAEPVHGEHQLDYDACLEVELPPDI